MLTLRVWSFDHPLINRVNTHPATPPPPFTHMFVYNYEASCHECLQDICAFFSYNKIIFLERSMKPASVSRTVVTKTSIYSRSFCLIAADLSCKISTVLHHVVFLHMQLLQNYSARLVYKIPKFLSLPISRISTGCLCKQEFSSNY